MNYGTPNLVATTGLNPCNEATTSPPHDVQVCGGAVHTSEDDGGGVQTVAMYPKQPFDFAGRTGHIVFDVSNDTQGSHGAWPELWVSDQPVPTPFAHEATLLSLPRNGFGIRLAGCTDTSGTAATCSVANGVGVDSAITVNNFVENDSFNGGSLKVLGLGSVTKSGPGEMNHYEVDVTQSEIDVYATNAFVPGHAVPPLVHVASIPGAGLSFTRGLVWLEDVHYNGNKFGTQGDHTFTWDNFGFDGPVLPQDRAFDVPDNTTPSTAGNGRAGTDTGWTIGPGASHQLSTLPVDATSIAHAAGAIVTFGSWSGTAPVTFHVTVNGHAITQPWPYGSSTLAFTARTLAVPVPLTDIVPGPNEIAFSTDGYAMNLFNVDLVLQGAGGVPAGAASSPPPVAPSTTTTPRPTTSTPPPTTTATSTTVRTGPTAISDAPCTVDFSTGAKSGTCTGQFVG
jgi:hypothetical protein